MDSMGFDFWYWVIAIPVAATVGYWYISNWSFAYGSGDEPPKIIKIITILLLFFVITFLIGLGIEKLKALNYPFF